MIARPKNLPRLWCALQGLLPLESCLAAQRGELAWPQHAADDDARETPADETSLAPDTAEGRGRRSLPGRRSRA